MENIPKTPAAQKRRELLENALLELMQTKGYGQISVTDICREANIPRRTFYHYFDCKEAVLQAVIRNMLSECALEIMLEFNVGAEAMRQGLIRNFEYWQGPERWKLDLLLDNGLAGDMTRCALQWVETERLSATLAPGLSSKRSEIAAMVGISGFFTLLMYWRRNEYRETPEEMAEYAMWVLSEPLYPH